MRGSRFGRLLFAALVAVTLSATLSASPIFGTFTLDGTIFVTPTTITWQQSVPAGPVDKAVVSNVGTSDSFTGLGSTIATIHDLDSTTEPAFNPDKTFSPEQPFVSFDANPLLPTLDINEVFAGFFSSAGCTLSPAMVGQTCTPPLPPPSASPFSFVNEPGIGGTIASAAVFNFSGITSDGLSTWTASFGSSFNVPFQTVLAQLASTGTVNKAFEGTFVVTPIPTTGTPEPPASALMGLGLGLVGLAAILRRRRAV